MVDSPNDPVDPIVVEETYNAPLASVWNAITKEDQMRQWFFEAMTDFQPQPGFETQFNVHHDGRDYLHTWRVTDVVPEERIAYRWRYEGLPGDSQVTWELAETSGGTKLTLTHQVLEAFPSDDPAFSRESGQAGWEHLLRERLKDFLVGPT